MAKDNMIEARSPGTSNAKPGCGGSGSGSEMNFSFSKNAKYKFGQAGNDENNEKGCCMLLAIPISNREAWEFQAPQHLKTKLVLQFGTTKKRSNNHDCVLIVPGSQSIPCGSPP